MKQLKDSQTIQGIQTTHKVMSLDNFSKLHVLFFNSKNEQSCWSLHCAMFTSTIDKNLVLDSKFLCDLLHYLVNELSTEDTKILVNNSLTQSKKLRMLYVL